ncbi:peroxide stress protein YaaA [Robertkochia aurantiaca]|uniref:peroxide stress protein YaaA n=1 Tax=Robertkochia aurantiaca TaxID=2873700 RepID=UPI001CC93831|nr:peroxide stress protein YaaA [Robertkochia sp. 3YJGBD-33]
MKLVLSPAKSLNYESEVPVAKATEPAFLEEAVKLNKALREKSPADLQELMGISEKLAELNWQRNQDFEVPFDKKNARQAIFAFDGDVYTGLDAYTISEENIDYLQNSVRILSGLYGVLKPLDLMQPYRLEMGTNFSVGNNKNLYDFWKERITAELNKELKENELFVNLASKEYFGAVDEKKLKTAVISPVFKDWKNGKLKIISFYAKKARGSMVRYMVENQVESLEGLKGFDYDDYSYSEEYTKKENEPVFIR